MFISILRTVIVVVGATMVYDGLTGRSSLPLIEIAAGLMVISWGLFLWDDIRGKKGLVFWALFATVNFLPLFY